MSDTITARRFRPTRDNTPSVLYRPGTSDEKVCVEVLDHNTYEAPRAGFLLEPGDRWLDGGSSIGCFAALAYHRGADHVVCVEPLPDTQAVAKVNAPNATHLWGALVDDTWDQDYVTIYRRPPEDEWRSSLTYRPDAATDSFAVPTWRLHDVIDEHDLDCVKLDIEGAEMSILEGWVPPDSVRKVVAEWSFDSDPNIDRARDVVDRYRTWGFDTHAIHTHVRERNEHNVWSWFPPAVLLRFSR